MAVNDDYRPARGLHRDMGASGLESRQQVWCGAGRQRPPGCVAVCICPTLRTMAMIAGYALGSWVVSGCRRTGKQIYGSCMASLSNPHSNATVRRFYPGGFEREMTTREAALILGVRERAAVNKIKEAHKRVVVANHPDAGGSHYIASEINEAKDMLMEKRKVRVFQFLVGEK